MEIIAAPAIWKAASCCASHEPPSRLGEQRDNLASDQALDPGNKQLAHADLIEPERTFVKREQLQDFLGSARK